MEYAEQPQQLAGVAAPGYSFTFESILESSVRALALDSQSLTSSVLECQEENGRTYHTYHAGSYHYPNDAEEAERYDEQYEILKRALRGKSYLAPLSEKRPPRRVLDIGTGTGTWCLDVGDEFPGATVLGTDLSPCLMPEYSSPNVHFTVDDMVMDWDPSFKGLDYIHTRMTLGCWEDMKRDIITRAFECLAPGGYLECQELHAPLLCDDKTKSRNWAPGRLFNLLIETAQIANRPLDFAPKLAGWLREAGFVEVREEIIKIPTNGWHRDKFWRDIGRAWGENLSSGLSAFSLALLSRVRGMTEEEVQLKLVDARRQLRDESVHAYQNFHVVWGRKPLKSERKSK